MGLLQYWIPVEAVLHTHRMKTEEETRKAQFLREFLSETLGTFALVLLGDGAVAQVVLGNAARGDDFFGGFLNISAGYGLAVMVGICISGGVSGTSQPCCHTRHG